MQIFRRTDSAGNTQSGTAAPVFLDGDVVLTEGAVSSGATPEAAVETTFDEMGDDEGPLGDVAERARDLGPGTERWSIEVD